MRIAAWVMVTALITPAALAQKVPVRSGQEQAEREDARWAVEQALAEMATEELAARDLAMVNVRHAMSYYKRYKDNGGVRWLELFEAASGVWLADLRTVQPDGPLSSVWVETPSTEGPAAYYRQQIFFNCGARTTVTRAWAAYTKAGTVLKSGDGANDSPRPVVPGTAIEGLMDWMCAGVQ